VARAGVFAQASTSLLGESSRSSLWFLLELSLRRRASILSDELSHSGEEVSLKRELAKTCLQSRLSKNFKLNRDQFSLSEISLA